MTERGVLWPLNKKSNSRSTTGTNKQVWVDAIKDLDANVAKLILNEKNWRGKYDQRLEEFGKVQWLNEGNALSVAQRGLESLYSRFTLGTASGEVSLKDASDATPEFEITSFEVVGKDKNVTESTVVDYFKGSVSIDKLKNYVKADQIEQDVVDSFVNLECDGAKIKKAIDSCCFVVLGATSELCPLKNLLDLGFTVVGISRPKEESQKKLIEYAENSKGTLILPKLPDDQTKLYGADIVCHPVELLHWLKDVCPEKRLVCGNYIYLDGALNVQACLAMDFIVANLCKLRPDTGMAILQSPAIPLPVKEEAVAVAERRYRNRSVFDLPLGIIFNFGRFPKSPNFKLESGVYIQNGLSNIQGPSYALAKMLQVWRATVMVHEGFFVSDNLTPACSTESVFHVRAVALALKGTKYKFPPFTVFEPEEARNTMAGLLVYDMILNQEGKAENIFELLTSRAVHGGVWTFPYKMSSIGKAAAMFGFFV